MLSLYHASIKVLNDCCDIQDLNLVPKLVKNIKPCCGGAFKPLTSLENDHYDCFEYAINGYTFPSCDFTTKLFLLIIKLGNLDALKCVYNKGITKFNLDFFALYGHLNCMKYCNKRGHLFSKYVSIYACSGKNLECLRYIHKCGYSWDESTTEFAAISGSLDCLKYCHENGCPWNLATTVQASNNNHLECLKYAHENGCPWDESIPRIAAINNNIDCLKYAYQNNCLWDDQVLRDAANVNLVKIITRLNFFYSQNKTSEKVVHILLVL